MKLQPSLEEKIERFGSESRILQTAAGGLSEAQIVQKIGDRVMADFNPSWGRNEIAIITDDNNLHEGVINYIVDRVERKGDAYRQVFVAGYCPKTAFLPTPEARENIYSVDIDEMMTYQSLMSN